jgi:hypothetical protein
MRALFLRGHFSSIPSKVEIEASVDLGGVDMEHDTGQEEGELHHQERDGDVYHGRHPQRQEDITSIRKATYSRMASWPRWGTQDNYPLSPAEDSGATFLVSLSVGLLAC